MSQQPAPVVLDLTFDLETDGGVTVIWAEGSVLGRRTTTFISPYSGRDETTPAERLSDLELMLLALDRIQSSSSHPNPSGANQLRLKELGLAGPDAQKVVGRALYAALGAGTTNLEDVRKLAGLATPLELRLHFPTALHTASAAQATRMATLIALPWELLWGPEGDPILLCHGEGSSCTRHLALDRGLPPARPGAPPLRVLPVIAQYGLDEASRQRERAARQKVWQRQGVAEALRELPEVSPATLDNLAAAFENARPGEGPDIVHIVAHGMYTGSQDGKGMEGHLLLDDGQGDVAPTPIKALVAQLKGVRLVSLAVCDSGSVVARMPPAGASTVAGGLLGGVAQALSAAGVPVVLAMQLVVRADAAYDMLAAFYQRIGYGESVQAALSAVRKGRYTRDQGRASWYVPVLYLATREHGPVYLLDSQNPAGAGAASPGNVAVSADRGGTNTNTTVIGNARDVKINNSSS